MNARAGLRVLIALAAVIAGAGTLTLFRSGYTPDEEYTVFAVRGIQAHGLPLLPSGLLYDRGLLYSYLSWLVAGATGTELPAFRGLSLLCATTALAAGYALLRRVASPAAGVTAAALVATSVPFWAVATTGRFYGPFLLTCIGLAFLLERLTGDHRASPGTLAAAATLAFLSRLTHELAFTLMVLPAGALVVSWCDPRGWRRSRRDWVMAGLAMLTGLVAAQAVLMGLHFLIPPSDGGGTMIKRFFLWQVLNLFERPTGTPLGVVCTVVVVGILAAPARAARTLRVGALIAALVTVATLVFAATTTSPTGPAGAVLAGSLAYPLDMFWHLVTTWPLLVWTAMVLLFLRLCGAGGEWPIGERATHLGWVGWALWFGVIESGITINYVLLPTVCLLAAIGLDLVAIGQHTAAIWPGRRAQLVRAALVGAALLVIADQWRGTGSIAQRLASARPTIDVAGIEAVRASLKPADRVACTDELACLMLVGRVDAWLALDDYVRERFVVMRDSHPVGVYAGAPAHRSVRDLFAPAPDGSRPARVIVVDVFKDYPIGHSSTWLPRAIAAEGLTLRTWLLTPEARVGEVGQ